MFYDQTDTINKRIQEGQPVNNNMPELSSLRLKKLFNNRLQNEPENLKKVISGVTKDITDISNLLLQL